ncbi:MAG: SDR family oxidoreductase [Myxococcales bacterium]|nr:SDR family oxidoreductase [Myxococcales bacterium]
MGLGAVRRTALVTGAAGFLGSHLCERLLGEGFEVVGIDNLMTGDLTNLESARKSPYFHFEIGDVREPIRVYAELVFNLACPASPRHYQDDPYATLTSSVFGAQRLVEMARGRRCTIIHASTSEVYGDPTVHPQPETYWGNVNPVGERSCYDEGKRCAETLLFDARRRWHVDARIVRIFNTYGPRMAFDDGRVVSNFITQALTGLPLTIFGDGSQSRSFCYVDDLIEGLVRTARLDALDGPMNLGNPGELTIGELAQLVIELTGSKTLLVRKALPQDDPQQRKPDITRAKREIGFLPQIDIRAGLTRTIDDFAQRLASIASQRQERARHEHAVAIEMSPMPLAKLANAIDASSEEIRSCGDAHRLGDRMRASQRFVRVSDSLDVIARRLSEAWLVYEGLTVGITLRAFTQQLADLVAQLLDAQRSNDSVRIADLLEYEMLPLLVRCRALAAP